MPIEILMTVLSPKNPFKVSCSSCGSVIVIGYTIIEIRIGGVSHLLLSDDPVQCPTCSIPVESFAFFDTLQAADRKREELSQKIETTNSIEFLKLHQQEIVLHGGVRITRSNHN